MSVTKVSVFLLIVTSSLSKSIFNKSKSTEISYPSFVTNVGFIVVDSSFFNEIW